MRLTSISITNMAGFTAFETKLPVVALIQGKNGEGKTSLLDCFRYCWGRGHDEDMIHSGAAEGEILIELDDGSAIKCRASREKSETVRSWRAPGAKRFVVSREQIDAVANALSYDPLAFMDMEEKKQVETLLRLMPIECTDEEIKAALGEVDLKVPGNGTGLDRIAALRKTCYDRRHDFNVSADSKEKHASELAQALAPQPQDGDWNKIVEALEVDRQDFEKQRQGLLDNLRHTHEKEKVAIDQVYDKAVELARTEREQQMEALRSKSNRVATEIGQDINAKLHAVTDALATAKERARSQAHAEGTRQSLEVAKVAAEQDRTQAKRLSDAITRLDALKETVASRLPIKDVIVQDGRILRKEGDKTVPFSRWNTESRMRFCLRIAVLAHGQAGFICIDHAEAFDADKRNALFATAKRYAESDGLQFLIATVADRSLTVTAAGV